MIYVDDIVAALPQSTASVSAALGAALLQVIEIPLSWKKRELGHSLIWNGWHLSFSRQLISLTPAKRDKALALLSQRAELKDLQAFGTLAWVTQVSAAPLGFGV